MDPHSTIVRGKQQLLDTWNRRCESIEDEIHQWKEKNQLLNDSIEQSHRPDLTERYRKNIDDEQKRAQRLQQTINFLK